MFIAEDPEAIHGVVVGCTVVVGVAGAHILPMSTCPNPGTPWKARQLVAEGITDGDESGRYSRFEKRGRNQFLGPIDTVAVGYRYD